MRKEEHLKTLLRNFVESEKEVKMAFLYSNQGLLISKYLKTDTQVQDTQELESVHGAFMAMIENLLEKISSEYNIDHYGSGSFETSDHRIIYLEAGSDAILLLVCSYETNLNMLFPIAYLVVEKIAQILEDSFDDRYNTLTIPNLWNNGQFSLGLDKYNLEHPKPILEGVYPLHQISKKERVQKFFKLIVLGPAAVGKTTLINQFLKNEQVIDYRPTLGISISSQNYYIQGNKDDVINFLIYDLAGQEFFKRVRHKYYKGANCAFVMYDVTRIKTFDETINFWFDDARNELGNIPFVLIGNKIDLQNRQVTTEEGINIAKELKCFFTETSALNNINVQDTFKLMGIGLFFQSDE
jgi:small GTP-binding protein